jgi:hypothetical protein
MMLDELIREFLNPLGADTAVHNSLSELMMAKMEEPQLSIKAAKKLGILELSTSNHYDQLEILGNLFIKGIISLEDFLLFHSGGTKICDATFIKREGKGVYGTKILKNYSKGCYEQLKDALFTVDRYGGANFIYAFKIINHKKRHRTKPEEIIDAIKKGKIKKGEWIITDGGLKSGELMREARKSGVKLVTRLDSNFVVVRFGVKFRKKDALVDIKLINRTIDGESYVIYHLKRCIWQGTAGNLFLIRGEGYDDFIPLFTTSLNAKPETIIRKYNERTSIEQTFKELKSYLKM